MIKRYTLDTFSCDSCNSYMEIDDQDNWVHWDDYAALETELDALQEQNTDLREMIDVMMAIPSMTDDQLTQLRANCLAAKTSSK